jgi:hypothetical protein
MSRLNGAIIPLPQYAFMAWFSVKSTGTTSPNLYQMSKIEIEVRHKRHHTSFQIMNVERLSSEMCIYFVMAALHF